jgi:hypothetical protein
MKHILSTWFIVCKHAVVVALQLATNDYPNKQLIIMGYCKFSFTCRVGSSSYMTHSFTSGPEEDLFIWFKNNGRSFLENLSSPPDFSGKCVARPLFFCVVLGHPYVHRKLNIFYLHDLLFVNMLSSWTQLKYWSFDVTQQSINHRTLRIQLLVGVCGLILNFWNTYQYVKQNVFIKSYSTTWLHFLNTFLMKKITCLNTLA